MCFWRPALASVLALAAVAAASPDPRVTNIGPTGGSATGVFVDPTVAGTLYAVCEHALCKSTDGGTTWAVVRGTPQRFYGVLGVAVTPSAPATVYLTESTHSVAGIPPLCGSIGVTISKSVDGGVSWQELHQESYEASVPPCGESEPVPDYRHIAIDPNAPDTVYVGGFLKTVDGGATWSHVGAGLLNLRASAVVVDPNDSSVVYVGVPSDGVYKSTDGGVSFVPAMAGLSTDAARDVRIMAVAPVLPTTLYIATAAGLFTSTDAAVSWMPIGALLPGELTALYVHPRGGIIFAASGGAVFVSLDGGISWPLRGLLLHGAQVVAFAVDVHEPGLGMLYAGTDRSCVVRSSDGGYTWETTKRGGCIPVPVHAVAIAPHSPSVLYPVRQEGAVFRTTDDGATWTLLDEEGAYAVAVDPTNSSIVYAARGDGIAKSVDGGAGWLVHRAGLEGRYVTGPIVIDPTVPSTLYVVHAPIPVPQGVVAPRGIAKSIDAGTTWFDASPAIQFPDPYDMLLDLLIDPSNPIDLFAAFSFAAVVKSTNGGATWRQSLNVFGGLIAIDPRTAALYAYGTGKFFESMDRGETWQYGPEIPGGPGSMVVHPSNSTLYAATPSLTYFDGETKPASLMVLRPGGDAWTVVGGLFEPYSDHLVMDPAGKALYATGSSGIDRLTLCDADADCDDGDFCTIDACDAATGICYWERETGCHGLGTTFIRIRRNGRITVKGHGRSDAPPRVDGSAGLAVRLVAEDGFSRMQAWAPGTCHVRRSGVVCRSAGRGSGQAIAVMSTRRQTTRFSIELRGGRLEAIPRGPVSVTLIGNASGLDPNAANAELALCKLRGGALVCRQAK